MCMQYKGIASRVVVAISRQPLKSILRNENAKIRKKTHYPEKTTEKWAMYVLYDARWTTIDLISTSFVDNEPPPPSPTITENQRKKNNKEDILKILL